jgi:hypothetical protein
LEDSMVVPIVGSLTRLRRRVADTAPGEVDALGPDPRPGDLFRRPTREIVQFSRFTSPVRFAAYLRD